MQCPECESISPDGMKFCGACGSALQLIAANVISPTSQGLGSVASAVASFNPKLKETISKLFMCNA